MESNSFIDLLMNNVKEDILDYVKSFGKGPKPVSPIYYFEDLTEEQTKIYKKPIYDCKEGYYGV